MSPPMVFIWRLRKALAFWLTSRPKPAIRLNLPFRMPALQSIPANGFVNNGQIINNMVAAQMVEINLLGSFPSLFTPDQLDRKVELIQGGGWFPDTDDMDSVVRRSKTTRATEISNIQQFLDTIKANKKG